MPPELKGLKVYTVWFNSVDYVNVAVLDGKTNSTTYQKNKTQETTIMLNHRNTTSIREKEILLENDTLIVCRKRQRNKP